MVKKGQAAMEFLMTYGWAILVVLIAIGALAYFGVLSPSRFLPSSCTLFPGLGCDSFIVTDAASPHVTLNIRNGLGQDITAVTITLEGDGIACAGIPHTGAPLAIFGDGDQVPFSFACAVGAIPSGNRFKSDLTIAFTQDGLAHTRSGQIVSEVE